MIVEVRGANTRNKGAELMLRAIAAELEGRHRVAVEPRVGSYDERARMGLLQKFSNRLPENVLRTAGRATPHRLRSHLLSKYGIVFEDGIDAILDASGFAYSDQFDLQRCVVAAERAERAQHESKPFVLLPQAFGPFAARELRAAFVRLVNAATLVYARESTSLEHLVGTGCRTDHVRVAPDFTCLVDGVPPRGLPAGERLALLVPSQKLLTHTSSEVRSRYLPLLAHASSWLSERGHDVRVLQHERDDVETIAALQELRPERLPVVRFENALHLKAVIGRAQIVVGSRFHALVSALSQGVPAVGLGWSHKYEMLFDDYACREYVVDPRAGTRVLDERLGALSGGGERERIVEGIRAAADAQRARARAMWAEVHTVLADPGRAPAVAAASRSGAAAVPQRTPEAAVNLGD